MEYCSVVYSSRISETSSLFYTAQYHKLRICLSGLYNLSQEDRRHQIQPAPMDLMRYGVNNVGWRDVTASIRRERRGERSSVYPEMSPISLSQHI